MPRLDLDHPSRRNLGSILEQRAQCSGDVTWLVEDGRSLTFAQVDAIVNRVARGLARLGVERGDRIAFFMRNAMEVVFMTLAANRLGAIWTPINAEYKGEWLAETLRAARARVIFSDTEIWPRLAEVLQNPSGPPIPYDHLVILDKGKRPVPDAAIDFAELLTHSDAAHDMRFIDQGDVNAILWTSGTTGKSKGVMQSHNIWIRTGERAHTMYGTRDGDRTYNVLPMYNTAAWSANIFRSLVEGIGCALDPVFSVSQFWERTRHFGATQTFTLGAMHIYLWNQPERPDDRNNPIRTAGMAPMPDHLIGPFCERFGIEAISQGFGQSECSFVTSRPPTNIGQGKPGALGFANPDLEIRLVDETMTDVPPGEVGEFLLRPRVPHMMFEGYFDNPEATAAAFGPDGWYHMGDLGRQDEDGEYYFVDRKRDAVRLAGRNISTADVELALGKHPAVHEIAVYGIRSAELADESELAAAVILKPGYSATAEELARFVNEHAPFYFVPRYIGFHDALPMTPTNKVQKYKLREAGVTPGMWDRKAAGLVLAR
jgi:crotonobetaine/carnitine-CoA ligase